MLAIGEVGNPVLAPSQDGDEEPLTYGRTGAAHVQFGHADFFHATIESRVWSAVTAVAGVAPGTSLSTTAAFWLHNPIGSKVVLSIIRSSCGYLSGTIGAGTVFYTTHAGRAVARATGTAIVPRNRLLMGDPACAAIPLTTATVTTQVAIRPAFVLGALAATDVVGITLGVDFPDGDIVVKPGYGVGLHAIAAAGTTPRVLLSMTWEEIPVVPEGV
jgi:hypothetical protein